LSTVYFRKADTANFAIDFAADLQGKYAQIFDSSG
jgi:hypothetical protein